MRTLFALALTFCAAAPAQSAEETRTFPFAHLRDHQSIQEVANTIRSIAEAPHVTADLERPAVTVRSSPERLALAAWLFAELDQPNAPPAAAIRVRDTAIADRRAPAVKVLHLAHLRKPQLIQEFVTSIRAIADLQRVAVVNATAAVAVRGSIEQVALAEWIARDIDAATGSGLKKDSRNTFRDDDLVPPQFRSPVVRIFYPMTMTEPLHLQETVNLLRVIAEAPRVFALMGPSAILMRGREDQADVAEWLLRELDQAAAPTGSKEYLWPGRTDGLVRVAYVPKGVDLPATWKRVREATGLQRVAVFHARRALVMRGTTAEVAAFDQALPR